MGLLETIKKAGKDAIEAENPVQVLFGEVTNTGPLEVNVEQRFTLTADFLVIPERLASYIVDLNHTHQYKDTSDTGTATKNTEVALTDPLIIRQALQVGDKLILLRAQGGQKFVVIDRVVNL